MFWQPLHVDTGLPHRFQATRSVRCPHGTVWRVCMLGYFSCVRVFATPWTVVSQARLPMGFSRQEYWSGLPCPPLGNLPDPGIKPITPASPAMQADSLPLSHLGSLYHYGEIFIYLIRLPLMDIWLFPVFSLLQTMVQQLVWPVLQAFECICRINF